MKKSRATVIHEFFALPGETLAMFRTQYVKLSEAERTELSVGAARAMGLTADQVAFEL